MFTYVGNNPINRIDPMGLAAKEILKRVNEIDKQLGLVRNIVSLGGLTEDYLGRQNPFHNRNMLSNVAFIYKNLGNPYNKNANDLVHDDEFKNDYGSEKVYLKGDFRDKGECVRIGQLANVMVGYSAAKVGFTKEWLQYGALEFYKTRLGNGFEDEVNKDRYLYDVGYELAELSENLSENTFDKIFIDKVIEADKKRDGMYYLKNSNGK